MKTTTIILRILAGMTLTAGCTHDAGTAVTKSGDTHEGLTPFASTGVGGNVTRTSMDGHQYLTGSDFYWEPGDGIYVKDDAGTLQDSHAGSSNITATQPTARFHVPGAYTASNTYEVYYTGTAATATSANVTIAAAQTQAAPNTARHIGQSGDCGTATATRVGDHFEFMLDHKAAYLCFLPRVTNAALGQNVYLTKVVVKSDNAIAGDYTLSLSGLSSTPANNAATQITLTTQGTDHPNGFPLTNTATSVATNAAYMVIAPGTHTLTVDYYIKDPMTGVEGAITKTLPAGKLFEANKVYDVTANLTPKDYSDHKYYMWDAQQDYWHGVSNFPTLNEHANPNYPQNDADPRWYNTTTTTQATQSCQACPNVNEMIWYTLQGDPHWDGTTVWCMWGHLYKGGMWFKKKAHISGFTPENYMGTDYRLPGVFPELIINEAPVQSIPIDIDKYFYLPLSGYMYMDIPWVGTSIHQNGALADLGAYGSYSSSSPDLADSRLAYRLGFFQAHVALLRQPRQYGFWTYTFE